MLYLGVMELLILLLGFLARFGGLSVVVVDIVVALLVGQKKR